MIILGFISLTLDLIILNVSPYTINNITFLFPMLTLVYITSMFYFSKKYNFSIYLIIFFYSLIGNSFFIPLISIFLLYFLISKYKVYIKENIISYIFLILFSLVFYDTFYFFILVIFDYLQFNISYLLYKILNSIVLNILYSIPLYFLFPVLISNKN